MGTGLIQARFEAFRELVLELDDNLDRITALEAAALSPSTSSWEEKHGGGIPGDRIGRAAEKLDMLRREYEAGMIREKEERCELEKIMRHITARERGIIRRRYFDAMDWETTAESSRLSVRGAQCALSRAFHKLEEI